MRHLRVLLAVVSVALAPAAQAGSDGLGPRTQPADGLDSRGTSAPQFIEPKPSPAIKLERKGGVVIDGLRIVASPSVVLRDCRDITVIRCDLRSVEVHGGGNIKVLNCRIADSKGVGVDVEGAKDLFVQGCRFERVSSALYALNSQQVGFIGNTCEDVQGPMPRGQMVQFDKVSGGGNRVTDNFALNRKDRSRPEDVISIYMSHGLPDDPILLAGNVIHGDPGCGSEGKSVSGSGILLGDGGGSWIVCRGNTIRSAGQVGIGVAGGSDIVVEGNDVVGRKSDVSNVGIYVWNQSKKPGGKVIVGRNRSRWTNAKGAANPWWNGGGFELVEVKENDFQESQPATSSPPSPVQTPAIPPKPYGAEPRFPWQPPDAAAKPGQEVNP